MTTGNVRKEVTSSVHIYLKKKSLLSEEGGFTQEFCGIKLTYGWQTWCWM